MLRVDVTDCCKANCQPPIFLNVIKYGPLETFDFPRDSEVRNKTSVPNPNYPSGKVLTGCSPLRQIAWVGT